MPKSETIQTKVYPESDPTVRLQDQKNGIGVGDNLVGRLKEGNVDKGIYMIPDHMGEEYAMVLTGRIELNEQASFDDNNNPISDRMVEVASITPESVNNEGEAIVLHKWVREAELAGFTRLDMDDNRDNKPSSSTPRLIGDFAVRESKQD